MGDNMITILLAVYNGEKYLKEQIDSLLNQTEKNIKIVIRDDGSFDDSPNIIDHYCSKYPNKITRIFGSSTGSARQNFAELFKNCDDDYIMFCDQDDVWLPKKVENSLALIKQNEGKDKSIPVLVHSDLSVVDKDLKVISKSFFNFQKLNGSNSSLSRLLVQNNVTGCTIIINRALKEKCGHIPDDCIMHDWWLALCAKLFGKIVFLDKPTILYRQHGSNQVGAKASYGIPLIKRKLATLSQVQKDYDATYTQASAILRLFGDVLSDKQKDIVATYSKIQKMNKFKKIYTVNKYNFKKNTLLRVIGQYILM